ncbi:flagellar motor protein MotB [Lewinella sp. IMCC34183]|uniref:OmpA/MotB family protein n=1 Tax=Lewinella sp. IMCC34183 TaxID=2248762 RepID=UPI0013005534|nr:OmpA family protein [Lewinella sp. IMCC34183]
METLNILAGIVIGISFLLYLLYKSLKLTTNSAIILLVISLTALLLSSKYFDPNKHQVEMLAEKVNSSYTFLTSASRAIDYIDSIEERNYFLDSIISDFEAKESYLMAEVDKFKISSSSKQSIIDSLKEGSALEIQRLKDVEQLLKDSLKQYEGISVTRKGNKFFIADTAEISFMVNSSRLSTEGQNYLKTSMRVFDIMQARFSSEYIVRIEGHTDSSPIVGEYPIRLSNYDKVYSNWELSSFRALSVAYFLKDSIRLDPKLIEPVALGPFHPKDLQNPEHNRRVVILLVPQSYE